MTNPHEPQDWIEASLRDDDFFEAFDFADKTKRVIDRRAAVRYVRDDIAVSIVNAIPFSFKADNPISLMNVNSRGILLQAQRSLGLSKNITLMLKFDSGKVFKIKGKIVNSTILASVHYEGLKYYYGIKFDFYNNELGEHLLATQSRLIIK
jgi:hypothetical protein